MWRKKQNQNLIENIKYVELNSMKLKWDLISLNIVLYFFMLKSDTAIVKKLKSTVLILRFYEICIFLNNRTNLKL